ncbi:MAG: DUF1819 family protein [Bacteroidales bacterium]|nr:DUF1819 family protein [Bacteroidales bacterium]
MPRFNSSINIIGSIPDYGTMIDYIIGKHTGDADYGASFQFRTEKSFRRFAAAINEAFLRFANDKHSRLFFAALTSYKLSLPEKLLLLFWQFIFNNELFRDITINIVFPALRHGRHIVKADEILSHLRYLKENNPGELEFSEDTLKIIATKYLTCLRKFGLAEGKQIKTIALPILSQAMLTYLIRWIAASSGVEKLTLDHPFMQFSFYDKGQLLSLVKSIDFIPCWDIAQIGNDCTIEIKPYDHDQL